jgi:hypothetical protein
MPEPEREVARTWLTALPAILDAGAVLALALRGRVSPTSNSDARGLLSLAMAARALLAQSGSGAAVDRPSQSRGAAGVAQGATTGAWSEHIRFPGMAELGRPGGQHERARAGDGTYLAGGVSSSHGAETSV